MKSLLASLTFLPIAAAIAATARAGVPPGAARPDAYHRVRLSWMSGITGSVYGGGPESALALDLRLKPLIVGAAAAIASGTGSDHLLALRVGYDFSGNEDLSLALVAEAGSREAHAGGGFMRDDPGVTLSEGFVGLRFAADYAVNDVTDPVIVRIGFSAFGRISLGQRESVDYSYTSCRRFNLFDDGDDCATKSATREVGGVHDFGVTLNLGLDFGRW